MGLEKKGAMQLGSQLDLTARSNGGLQRTFEVWLQERLQKELQMLKGCSAVHSSMSVWWTMHWELGFFMVKQHWILCFLRFLLHVAFIHGSKDFLERKSFFSISKVVFLKQQETSFSIRICPYVLTKLCNRTFAIVFSTPSCCNFVMCIIICYKRTKFCIILTCNPCLHLI